MSDVGVEKCIILTDDIWELFCKTTEDSLRRNVPHKTADTKMAARGLPQIYAD